MPTNYGLKKFFFLLTACSLLMISGACATPESTFNDSQMTSGKSGPVWPPPPQKPRIRYLYSISSIEDIGIRKSWFKKVIDTLFGKEESERRILRPYGVFAAHGRVYVTDPGKSILHVFDMQEKGYFQIKKGRGELLRSPIGIAVDESGDIYLTDSISKYVFVFNKKGNYLREVGSPELFARPAGIAVDTDRIYVIDAHSHRVLVFAKENGKLLFTFGKNGTAKGEFNYPTNIFLGKDHLLYITDSLNFRVQIFSRDGNFLSVFGKQGDGSGDLSKPKGVAVDSEGHIYVADAHFDNVQIFDREGRLLLILGNTGRDKGQMILPAGIFIDALDRIYVADSYNNRIQVFQYLKENEG